MAGPPEIGLSENREITVVLRLLVEQDGTIVHGHIVDPGERPAGPFLSSGFGQALQAWVSAHLAPYAEPRDRRGPDDVSRDGPDGAHD